MKRWSSALVGAIALSACSGSPATTVAPPPRPSETPPQHDGLGRMPDQPIVACPHERASAPLDPDATPTECRHDAQCTAGQNGRCLRVSNHGGHGPALEATRCSYDACFGDADCGPRAICLCATRAPSLPGEGHACASSECASDAECGADGYCRRTESGNVCHTLGDRCVEETDCGPGLRCQRPGSTGAWNCMPFTMPTG